jgi:predicted Zn-dependent protease
LSKRGTEIAASAAQWTKGVDTYRAHMLPFRQEWLDDDMTRGNGNASVVMLERLTKAEPDSGLLQYYLGEAYRRRNVDGDQLRAINAYTAAAAKADAPPRAWRELGLVAMKRGDAATARTDFATYLAHAPAADDRQMIEFYMAKVSGT